MRFTKKIGFILLAIYLILIGLAAVIPGFAVPSIAMGVIALVTGVFVVLDK